MLLFRKGGDEKLPKLEVVKHELQMIPSTAEMGADAPGIQQ